MPKPTMTGVRMASSAGVASSTLGRRGADGDDPAVLGLLGVVHDPGMLAELAPYLEHDGAGRTADGPDGQRREEEGDRAPDEQPDEGGRVGHVDLDDREQLLPGRMQTRYLIADGLDERGEEGHRGDDGGADGHALGDGLGGVAHGVEADHDPLGLAGELAATSRRCRPRCPTPGRSCPRTPPCRRWPTGRCRSGRPGRRSVRCCRRPCRWPRPVRWRWR